MNAVAGLPPVSAIDLPYEGPSAREARRWARGVLAGFVTDETLDDVLLCFAELVTNAQEHTSPTLDRKDITCRLEMTRADGVKIHGQVIDAGSRDKRPTPRQVGTYDVTGRGLAQVVEGCADEWGYGRTPAGEGVTWFTIQRATGAPQDAQAGVIAEAKLPDPPRARCSAAPVSAVAGFLREQRPRMFAFFDRTKGGRSVPVFVRSDRWHRLRANGSDEEQDVRRGQPRPLVWRLCAVKTDEHRPPPSRECGRQSRTTAVGTCKQNQVAKSGCHAVSRWPLARAGTSMGWRGSRRRCVPKPQRERLSAMPGSVRGAGGGWMMRVDRPRGRRIVDASAQPPRLANALEVDRAADVVGAAVFAGAGIEQADVLAVGPFGAFDRRTVSARIRRVGGKAVGVIRAGETRAALTALTALTEVTVWTQALGASEVTARLLVALAGAVRTRIEVSR